MTLRFVGLSAVLALVSSLVIVGLNHAIEPRKTAGNVPDVSCPTNFVCSVTVDRGLTEVRMTRSDGQKFVCRSANQGQFVCVPL